MITRLKIDGLFGRFDYDLVFKNPMTILTGPNGFGKSTILKMIEALGSGVYDIFFQVPYDSIVVEFDNKSVLNVKYNMDHLEVDRIKVTFNDLNVMRHGNFESPFFYQSEKERFKFSDFPLDGERSKRFAEIYGDNLLEAFNHIYEIKTWSGNVKRITEQRMLKEYQDDWGSKEIQDAITGYPDYLIKEFGNAEKDFSKKSSEIDSDFLNRLIESDEITEEQYNGYQKQVNEKFDKLERYNLMTERKQAPAFQPKHAAAFKVYFDTFFEKYAVYDAFLEKLDLFVGIVNNRLMFKKLEISREKGFAIIDEMTGDSLALEQLSSGEKQVIVLYYDLIFNDNKDLLLLIDEPEISMHVSWQSKFMEDLIRIAEHGNFRAIVATHSPDIINGLWDLQIDLGEQYQGNLYGEDEGESHGD